MDRKLHDELIVIDALEYSDWEREILEEIHRGGVTAINATLVLWETARETLHNIGEWNRRLRENADILMPVRTRGDVLAAKQAKKVGVIFGTQNTSLFEHDLDLVQIFHDLGVRVVQLTYNTQNLVGGSCYEEDSGLSRFGRNVIREMNRVGMVVDLSHVGERTGMDAIKFSQRPVAVTHANPKSFYNHRRNKSDELLEALADGGGIIGLSVYPHIAGPDQSIGRWLDMVKRTVDLIGIEHVGIGSDTSRKWSDDWLIHWCRMGRWTHEVDYGAGTRENQGWAPWPKWYETPEGFPNITNGLVEAGFNRDEVAAIMGGNWLRVFGEGFEPTRA